MTDEKCISCYSCQVSVAPEITVEDLKANDGKLKPEWLRSERCQVCYDCQHCVSAQAPCDVCYESQNP